MSAKNVIRRGVKNRTSVSVGGSEDVPRRVGGALRDSGTSRGIGNQREVFASRWVGLEILGGIRKQHFKPCIGFVYGYRTGSHDSDGLIELRPSAHRFFS